MISDHRSERAMIPDNLGTTSTSSITPALFRTLKNLCVLFIMYLLLGVLAGCAGAGNDDTGDASETPDVCVPNATCPNEVECPGDTGVTENVACGADFDERWCDHYVPWCDSMVSEYSCKCTNGEWTECIYAGEPAPCP